MPTVIQEALVRLFGKGKTESAESDLLRNTADVTKQVSIGTNNDQDASRLEYTLLLRAVVDLQKRLDIAEATILKLQSELQSDRR